MNDVNAVGAAYLNSLSLESQNAATAAEETEGNKNELGQSAFLELMITQLNNQNPLDPQDNAEFVAQLAQFSSVEGLERLNGSMDSMAAGFQSSQALQASALVGRQVRVETDSALLNGSGINGSINLPQSTSDLTVNVYNSVGQLVKQVPLGQKAAGDMEFAWDGTDSAGQALPFGRYRFEALSMVGGAQEAVPTYMSANVNSVTLGQAGAMTLNIEGVGPTSLANVKQIL